MIRLNITDDETKVVSFDTAEVDEISLYVNNTEEVVVAFSDGTTLSLVGTLTLLHPKRPNSIKSWPF